MEKLKRTRLTILGLVVLLLITSTSSNLVNGDRVVVSFQENHFELSYEDKIEIDSIALQIKLIARDENYSKYEIYLISRSTKEEFQGNRYIGVNRALNVRNHLMNNLNNLRPEDFCIQDFGITKLPIERGIQVFIVNER